jgi:hypothetical protein
VAELIRRELGVEAELVEGKLGEFTVWVDDQMVAKKGWLRFPSDQGVLSEVRQILSG